MSSPHSSSLPSPYSCRPSTYPPCLRGPSLTCLLSHMLQSQVEMISLDAFEQTKAVASYSFASCSSSPVGSIYTTVALGMERYITVCHPFYKISHYWGARRYSIPIALLAISYNFTKSLELEVKEVVLQDDPLETMFVIKPTDLR